MLHSIKIAKPAYGGIFGFTRLRGETTRKKNHCCCVKLQKNFMVNMINSTHWHRELEEKTENSFSCSKPDNHQGNIIKVANTARKDAANQKSPLAILLPQSCVHIHLSRTPVSAGCCCFLDMQFPAYLKSN